MIIPSSSHLTASQAIDSFRVSLPSRQCTKLAPFFVSPKQTVLGRFLSPFLKWSLSLWMLPDWQLWKLHFSVCRHQICSQSLQGEISLSDLCCEPTLGQKHSPVWTKHCFSLQITISLMNLTAENATSINSINFYDMRGISQELCWNYQFIHRELGIASLLCLKSFQSKPDLWHVISMWAILLEHHLLVLGSQATLFYSILMIMIQYCISN